MSQMNALRREIAQVKTRSHGVLEIPKEMFDVGETIKYIGRNATHKDKTAKIISFLDDNVTLEFDETCNSCKKGTHTFKKSQCIPVAEEATPAKKTDELPMGTPKKMPSVDFFPGWQPFIEACQTLREAEMPPSLEFKNERGLFSWNMKHANNAAGNVQNGFNRFENMFCMVAHMCWKTECTPSFIVIQECNTDRNTFLQELVKKMNEVICGARYNLLSSGSPDIARSEYDIIYAESEYKPAGDHVLDKDGSTHGHLFCTFQPVRIGGTVFALGTTHVTPTPRCINELDAYHISQAWDTYVTNRECNAILAGDFNTIYNVGKTTKKGKETYPESKSRQVCRIWSGKMTSEETLWGQPIGADEDFIKKYRITRDKRKMIKEFHAKYTDVVFEQGYSTSLLQNFIYDGIVLQKKQANAVYISSFPNEAAVKELKSLQDKLNEELEPRRDAFMNSFGDHKIVGVKLY